MSDHGASKDEHGECEAEQKCARGLAVEEAGNRTYVRHLLAEKFLATSSILTTGERCRHAFR
jgi:hypothetical protein